MKDLEEVRFFLTKPSNILVHMMADLSSLSSPLAPWSSILPPHLPRWALVPPSPRSEHLLSHPPPRQTVVGLGSCKNAFLSRSAPAILGGWHQEGYRGVAVLRKL